MNLVYSPPIASWTSSLLGVVLGYWYYHHKHHPCVISQVVPYFLSSFNIDLVVEVAAFRLDSFWYHTFGYGTFIYVPH